VSGAATLPPSRSGPWIAAALLILAAHVTSTVALGPSALGSVASNLLQVAASAVACVVCVRTARRAAAFTRRFWIMIAAAFAIWTAAALSYTYLENWELVFVTQPSWTHFLFRLYGAPLLMALLLAHDEDSGKGPDWQQVLDAAQVGILFLFFYFDIYFVPGEDWKALTTLEFLGFLDLSDLENWALCLGFFARARWSRRPEDRDLFRRVFVYLFCYGLSSSFYNYAYTFWDPRTGEWPDLVFTVSLTVASIAAATWNVEGTLPKPETGLPVVSWVPAALPLLTLALALPVARYEPDLAFVVVFGSIACFGARLVTTLYRGQRLMEQLKESEARYASLLRLAPDAIFVHAAGRISFANPATARLFGFESSDELVGRDALEFAQPERRPLLVEEWKKDATEPDVRRFTAIRRDGRAISLDVVAMSFVAGTGASGESGASPRLVIARDVTAHQRALAEREALIRELEAKNRELERFTYTVSHDLRSPLITVTAFLSHIETAAVRGDLEAVREDIQRVRRATRKMDLLLRDLLELSRIGHVLASPDLVSFDAIAREAVELVTGRLKERGVEVEIDTDLPVVMGDRARLLEVLQNLLDNAAKFMGEQTEPRVRIGARLGASGTELFVRDNGLGISTQHHERIFGLFDKLNPKDAGTGVGLALVKRIVELHGGRIWVESNGVLQGSTFVFTIPTSVNGPAVS
jgi:PAS domain S-box-containing protein